MILEHLYKSYGNLAVLNDCSFSFSPAGTYCLMAPSGAGKTTLLRIILGLEQADQGSVSFPWLSRPADMSAVFQENRLCESFYPMDNLRLVTGKSLSQDAIRRELSFLLPEESLSRPVSTLSGGMKRRTAICRAMTAGSDLIVMDEPFTGLDEDTKKQTISYIKSRQNGRLLLVATHQPEDISLLGAQLVTLKDGKLI